MDVLADELDDPAGEGNGIKETGISEVRSREGGRLLRLRTRAEEAHKHQRDYSGR